MSSARKEKNKVLGEENQDQTLESGRPMEDMVLLSLQGE